MARLTEEMVIARSRQSDLSTVKKLNCWYVFFLFLILIFIKKKWNEEQNIIERQQHKNI